MMRFRTFAVGCDAARAEKYGEAFLKVLAADAKDEKGGAE